MLKLIFYLVYLFFFFVSLNSPGKPFNSESWLLLEWTAAAPTVVDPSLGLCGGGRVKGAGPSTNAHRVLTK